MSWFLIECDEGQSYLIIQESKVIYGDSVDIGDEVQYPYPVNSRKPKLFKGKVLMMSDNEELLESEMEKRKKNQKQEKKRRNLEDSEGESHDDGRGKRAKKDSAKKKELQELCHKKGPIKTKSKTSEMKEIHYAEANMAAQKISQLANKYSATTKESESVSAKHIHEKEDSEPAVSSKDSDSDRDESGDGGSESSASTVVLPKESKRKKVSSSLTRRDEDADYLREVRGVQKSPSKDELKRLLAQANLERAKLVRSFSTPCSSKSKTPLEDTVSSASKHTPSDCKFKQAKEATVTNTAGPFTSNHRFSNDSDSYHQEKKPAVLKPASYNNGSEKSGSEDELDSFSEQIIHTQPSNVVTEVCEGVYISNSALKSAKTTSTTASSMARKMLGAVFKPAALLECSLTGAPPKGKGKEGNQRRPSLHPSAVTSIMSMATAAAKEKGWSFQQDSHIRQQMGKKLWELRNEAKLNKKLQ